MKKTIITCDRCDREIEGKPAVLKLKSGGAGHPLAPRELCPACEDTIVLTIKSRGHARSNGSTNGKSGHVLEAYEAEMQRVRELAADGIEAWANGANVDQLAQVLRDVASHARR